MKIGTTTHPKFKRLQKKLKLPTYAVAGLLELLWMLTAQYSPEDGELTRFSAEEIADYCDFEGDADSLLTALVEARWLDRDADSLRVHDWVDHRPGYIEERIQKREYRKKLNVSDSCPATVHDSPRRSADNLTQPSQAKPSQAKPIPTQPSLAKPSHVDLEGRAGVACEAAGGFDFLLAAESRIPDVARVAKAIDKHFGAFLNGTDHVWRLAWVSVCIGERCMPEIIEKYNSCKGTDRQIKQPARWLNGCLKREIEAFGVSLDDAIERVRPWEEFK